MCTYNGERFLQDQLESFIKQTRLPDELVICDDGSQDNTIIMLNKFAIRAPFLVRIYINEHNLGYSKNFEKAMFLCQGDIILPSDQDDVWVPEKIATIEDIFHNRPKIDYVFSDCEMVNDKLESLNYTRCAVKGFNHKLQKRLENNQGVLVFIKTYASQGCTLAFRSRWREVIFPSPDGWSFDNWMGLAMSAMGKMVFIPKPLVRYRQHGLQVTCGLKKRSFSEPYDGCVKRGIFTRVFQARESPKDVISGEIDNLKEAKKWFIDNNNHKCNKLSIVSLIDEKIEHLKARTEMPVSPWRRIPFILKELVNRRYFYYCRGWRSAVRDLISKPYLSGI